MTAEPIVLSVLSALTSPSWSSATACRSSRAPPSIRTSGRQLSSTRNSRRPNGTATSRSAAPANTARAPKRASARRVTSGSHAADRPRQRPGGHEREDRDGDPAEVVEHVVPAEVDRVEQGQPEPDPERDLHPPSEPEEVGGQRRRQAH